MDRARLSRDAELDEQLSHRANILNRDFTSIGVGHYKDASGTDYWTQLFIK